MLLHQRDDGAALSGLIRIARQQRGARGFLFGHARHRDDFRREAIAEGDGASLVQQQRIDIAGGFNRAARHRQHVEAHQTIHAGDADRRQQGADGGRNQGYEQRDQNDDGDGAAGIGDKARNGRGCEHEDDREADQQNIERDLVRRLLPRRAFHQLDHAVEKRRSRRRGDANDDSVGNHRGATRHRRTIAAGFTDHRRGLTGHRGLVHRGNALDHLAVARNDVAGFAHHEITGLELIGRNAFVQVTVVGHQ